MKNGLWLLILLPGLAACNNESGRVTGETHSLRQELDTAGENIGGKAEAAGDSVTKKLQDIKEAVDNRIDSIKRARKDATD